MRHPGSRLAVNDTLRYRSATSTVPSLPSVNNYDRSFGTLTRHVRYNFMAGSTHTGYRATGHSGCHHHHLCCAAGGRLDATKVASRHRRAREATRFLGAPIPVRISRAKVSLRFIWVWNAASVRGPAPWHCVSNPRPELTVDGGITA